MDGQPRYGISYFFSLAVALGFGLAASPVGAQPPACQAKPKLDNQTSLAGAYLIDGLTTPVFVSPSCLHRTVVPDRTASVLPAISTFYR